MYTVFVTPEGGSGEVVLTTTDDGQQASQLVSILVSAARGVKYTAGVHIDANEPAPPSPAGEEKKEQPTHPKHGLRPNR